MWTVLKEICFTFEKNNSGSPGKMKIFRFWAEGSTVDRRITFRNSTKLTW